MIKLWLDLGNTRLKYWIIQDETVLAFDAKEHLKAPNELLLGLLETFVRYRPDFIGISSVLGAKINQTLAHTLSSTGIAFEFATVNHRHLLLSSLYNPIDLGVDRWLQMLGAVGGEKLCIIGCGTALTMDVIDVDVHLGGYILPNVYMQRHALYAGTQQIAVKEGKFDSIMLGTNTLDAVNHGVLFGIVGAIGAFCQTYHQHRVILTGGGAQLILPHLPIQADIDDGLLLRGLQRYFEYAT